MKKEYIAPKTLLVDLKMQCLCLNTSDNTPADNSTPLANEMDAPFDFENPIWDE